MVFKDILPVWFSARSAINFNFAAPLVSTTVIGFLDDFAPFRFGVVGLRNPSIFLSGLGVSLNNLVGLVPKLVLCSSLVDDSKSMACGDSPKD